MNMLAASMSSNRLRWDAGQQHDMKNDWGSFADLMSRMSLLKYIYIFRFTIGLNSLFLHPSPIFAAKPLTIEYGQGGGWKGGDQ